MFKTKLTSCFFESGPYEGSCKDTISDKKGNIGHSYLSLIVTYSSLSSLSRWGYVAIKKLFSPISVTAVEVITVYIWFVIICWY